MVRFLFQWLSCAVVFVMFEYMGFPFTQLCAESMLDEGLDYR